MKAVRKLDVSKRSYREPEAQYSVSVTIGGRPVPGLDTDRIVTVEETVMHWTDASHIHGWFVDNVQGGKTDRSSYLVSRDDLRKLLCVCEAVLFGSHLVRGPVMKPNDHGSISRRCAQQSSTPMAIKNVAAAHRLLPLRDYGGWTEIRTYGEGYLNQVEATRAWAERMLIDYENGAQGDIYYTSNG